jgi:hypothetical protein
MEECMRSVPTRSLTTVEDKDPSVLWVQDPLAAHIRWAIQLEAASDRWCLIWARESDAVVMYRTIFDFLLPKRYKLGPTAINGINVPYMYTTIKRKCWEPGKMVRLMYAAKKVMHVNEWSSVSSSSRAGASSGI